METDATWKRVSRVLGTLRSRSAKPYAFSKTIFPFSLARTAPLKFPLCTYGWRYASMRSATELSCAKACSQQKVKSRRDKTIRINIPPLHRLRFVNAKNLFVAPAPSRQETLVSTSQPTLTSARGCPPRPYRRQCTWSPCHSAHCAAATHE